MVKRSVYLKYFSLSVCKWQTWELARCSLAHCPQLHNDSWLAKSNNHRLYLVLVSSLSNSLYFLQLKHNKKPLSRPAKSKDNPVMFWNTTCCSRTLVLSTTSTSMASSLANRYLLTPTIVSKKATETEFWFLIKRSKISRTSRQCQITFIWGNGDRLSALLFGGGIEVTLVNQFQTFPTPYIRSYLNFPTTATTSQRRRPPPTDKTTS